MTERYAHLSPDHKREAVNKIEEKMLFNLQNHPQDTNMERVSGVLL
jgi:hypothetical protein